MNLTGKVALVTGGSKGIGLATAGALQERGAKVYATYRQEPPANGGIVYLRADLNDHTFQSHILDYIDEPVDILVNNAGGYYGRDLGAAYNHLVGYVGMTQAVLNHGPVKKIVNVTSLSGRLGHGSIDSLAHAAMNAAIESWTKNLAKVCAPDTLVNAVAPGRVRTPLWGDNPPDVGTHNPIRRWVLPEEVADAILFLVKNDAMCGEILTVDGGLSLVEMDA